MSIMERINRSESLRYRVIFDPPGNDVNEWLTMIGFILSPSDFESFHLAVGEGMFTGSVPVVWDWPGSSEIWPKASIVRSAELASERIFSFNGRDLKVEGARMREYILKNYATEDVVALWEDVILN